MRMQPGDIVFLKGRVVRHLIEDWTGGQRISVPHFTHTSTWKMVAELADRLGADEDETEIKDMYHIYIHFPSIQIV